MDRHFGNRTYNLRHLFMDEQRRVLSQVMAQTLAEIESSFRDIYEDHFPLLRFLHEIRMPIPRQLGVPVEVVLVGQFRTLLEADQPRPEELSVLAEEVEKLDIALDEPMLGLAADRQLLRQMEKLAVAPGNLALLLTICETAEVLRALPIRLDLWQAQNLYWRIHRDCALTPAAGCDRQEWGECFRRLGDALGMRPG
jgi:hypothetical protein